MDSPMIPHFVSLTVFILVFAIGINHSFEQLIYRVDRSHPGGVYIGNERNGDIPGMQL